MIINHLQTLIVTLAANIQPYMAGLSQAVTATRVSVYNLGVDLQQFGAHWSNVAKQVRAAGKLMTLYLTAPIAAVGAMSVKSFSSFDQAMTETFAKMGRQSPEVVKQMEDLAKALSTEGTVAFSPTELAKGYEELAAAGLNAEQTMASIRPTAMLAQAGMFDMDVAVKMLIGSMASYGAMSTDPLIFANNLQRFSDVMVGVANTTTTGVEEVARAMSADGAVAARNYGMSIEELGAVLGVYAMQNKDAEEAGHLTGRAIRLMTSSFQRNAATWKKFGIDMVDKSTGQYIKFSKAIGLIEKAMAGMTGPMRTAFLDLLGFETLAQKSILPLIGQSQELERQEKIYQQTGTTLDMAKIQMESFANQIKLFTNTVRVAAIEVGKMLAPYILQATKIIASGIAYWRSLSEETKKLVLGFVGVVAALGPATIGLSVFMSLIGYAATVLSSAWSLIVVTGTALLRVGVVASVVGATVSRVFQDISARAGGLVGVWEYLSTAAMNFYKTVEPVIVELGRLWEWLVNGLKDITIAALEIVTSSFSSAMQYISTVSGITWNSAISWVVEWLRFTRFALQNAGLVAQYMFLRVKLGLQMMWEDFKWVFTSAIPSVLVWLYENWQNIFFDILNFTRVVFENLVGNVVNVFKNIKGIIYGTVDWKSLWKPLTDGFVSTIEELPTIAPRVLSTAEIAIQSELQGVQDTIANSYANMVSGDMETDRLAKEQRDAAANLAKQSMPAWEAVLGEALKMGKKAGEGFESGFDVGSKSSDVKSVDNVGRWSNEALHRIQAFTEAGPGMRGKVLSTTGALTDPIAGKDTLTEVRLDKAREDQRMQERMTELMKQAVDQLIKLNEESGIATPVILSPAGL